jgi:hypothetical protein
MTGCWLRVGRIDVMHGTTRETGSGVNQKTNLWIWIYADGSIGRKIARGCEFGWASRQSVRVPVTSPGGRGANSFATDRIQSNDNLDE